jgi:hypothetical protein
MGWSFGKSFRFGPARINVSTSGIGASFGVRGARISFGPRGTEVHLGRGGLRYRAKIGNGGNHHWDRYESDTAKPTVIDEPRFQTIEYSDVSASQDLLVAQIEDAALFNEHQVTSDNSESVRVAGTIWTIAASLAAMAIGAVIHLAVGLLALPLVLVVGLFLTFHRSTAIRTRCSERAIVHFSLESTPQVRDAYDALVAALHELSATTVGEVRGIASVADWKRNSGAGTLLDTVAVDLGPAHPECMSADFEIMRMQLHQRSIYFLPDRILVQDLGRFGSISYSNLTAHTGRTEYIVSSAPRDAQVIGTTWRYVNKDGGPDRRFSDNYQMAVCIYGTLALSTEAGVIVAALTSDPDAPRRIADALAQMAAVDAGQPEAPVAAAEERPVTQPPRFAGQRNQQARQPFSVPAAANVIMESRSGAVTA